MVATRIGTEGIHVQDGVDVLLASSADEFTDRTVERLLDRSRRETLGRNARALIAREHRWSRNLEELEREYAPLVGQAAGYGSLSQPLSTA